MKFRAEHDANTSTPCARGRRFYPGKLSKLVLPFIGLASTIWVLIRIIPKPSRATYPCMRVAAPLATTFIAYLIGGLTSIFSFKKARTSFKKKQYRWAFLFVGLFAVSSSFLMLHSSAPTYSYTHLGSGATTLFTDPLGPNQPIGVAKGIYPGRVVWVYDPAATNENCDPDKKDDAYFQDNNCEQSVVNRMVSDAVRNVADAHTDAAAWDAIFHYFNQNHDKGDVGYSSGEKIFMKINLVNEWTVDQNGNVKYDGGYKTGGAYGEVDTSPQVVYAMLDQLVNQAGVPQDMISVGDPFSPIPNHCYNKWSASFPDVHYVVRQGVSGMTGREAVTKKNMKTIYYSDKGTILDQATDQLVDCISQADYVLDLPAFKGHRWGGVTLFGKNFFGVNSRGSASHLHPGLFRTSYGEPLRDEYRMYRVFVDLLASKNLGGKTLLFLLDGLWATSEEHLPPAKFQTTPFNNDWTSSIMASLDPVAIESVCLDILQKEFKVEDLNADPPRNTFVQWNAVDDYLHQAASSDWWPEGIQYDPDNTGTPVPSLGVHEHWDNANDMAYSRNLGTGEGIELVKLFSTTRVAEAPSTVKRYTLSDNYPNPFNPQTRFQIELADPAFVTLGVYNVQGQNVAFIVNSQQSAGVHHFTWNGKDSQGNPMPSGVYLYRFQIRGKGWQDVKRGEMVLMR